MAIARVQNIVRETIGHELSNCCRRPTKRMVLRLAYILFPNRVRPCDLVEAQELLSELWKRVERAKI